MLKMEADYILRKDWADSKNELLEEQLAKILTKLELTAKQLKKERIEAEERQKYRTKLTDKEALLSKAISAASGHHSTTP